MNGQEKQFGRIVSTCVAALIAMLTVATTLAVATALVSTAPASSEPGAHRARSTSAARRSRSCNRLPAIRFSYPRKADVTLNNTGSPDEEATVRADVPAGAASITLNGTQYTSSSSTGTRRPSTRSTATGARWRCTWSTAPPTARCS